MVLTLQGFDGKRGFHYTVHTQYEAMLPCTFICNFTPSPRPITAAPSPARGEGHKEESFAYYKSVN